MCMGHTQPSELGPESRIYRTGLGAGASGLRSPLVMEFGLRVNFQHSVTLSQT